MCPNSSTQWAPKMLVQCYLTCPFLFRYQNRCFTNVLSLEEASLSNRFRFTGQLLMMPCHPGKMRKLFVLVFQRHQLRDKRLLKGRRMSETYRRQHKVKRAQEERNQGMAFNWWAVAFVGLISVSREQNG